MAVYGYTRIASEPQAQAGVALAEQERQIRTYAERHSLALASMYHEVGSAGVPLARRERGEPMLAQLQRGDILIVAKVDRLFRDCRHGLQLLKWFQSRGVELHMIDLGGEVTANGELFTVILAACAAFEEERIKERQEEEARSSERDEDCWEARLREEDC
jgi:putative DNA-invertase from lambdoid prophage Rac